MSDRTDNDRFAKVLFGHTDAGHALPWEQLPDGKRNYYREGARAVLAAARKEKPPIESALNRAKLEGKIRGVGVGCDAICSWRPNGQAATRPPPGRTSEGTTMTFKPDDQIGPGTVLCADNQTGRRSVAPGMAGDDPSAEPDDGWLKRGLESAASVATSARITPEDGPLHIPSPTGDLLDHEAHIKRPSLPDGAILRTLARVVVELWDSPSWRNIHVTECEVRQVKDWLARK